MVEPEPMIVTFLRFGSIRNAYNFAIPDSSADCISILWRGGECLKGAIVFIAAFLLFLVITLGYPELPPGNMIYDAIVGDVTTDYPVLGIGASALVAAVFNGAVYGVIIWLIYSVAER